MDAGVSVTMDGGDLVLHASAEPPHTVLSGLSRHKAAIVALLRRNDLWTAPAGEPRPIPIRELIAAAVVNGTTFSLSGAHVRLGGTPPPPNIQRELRARRKEVWEHLGGAALDQPALELMAHLGVEAVLVTNPAEALAALGDGPLGVDIETAHRLPRPPARFTRRGDLSATQPKSDDEAGLDPHHAEIATLQLYAGGQQSFVFRGAAITSEVRRRVLQGNCIVHNAAFELAFFRHHWGAFPVQFECTMQAAGLLLGVHRRGLADTAYACMGVKVPKELQRSDWGAEELSAGQIAYAAADAVLAYRLWPRISERLRTKQRYSAYELQRDVIPAVVDMQLRGMGMDVHEHVRQVEEWDRELSQARQTFANETQSAPPSKPDDIRKWLETVLDEEERRAWPTTKTGKLSTARSDLDHLADKPGARPLLNILAKEKLRSTFGAKLRKTVNSVTSRLHTHYNIAAAKSGRFTSSRPNLQQLPAKRAPEFKKCIVARPGYLLIACDWSAVELRAAAWVAGDAALADELNSGRDFHRQTAAAMASVPVEQVTDDQRQAAKAVAFGSIYGMGAKGLVHALWSGYQVEISEDEARQKLDRFFAKYRKLRLWCRSHAEKCTREGLVRIGCGRVVEERWEPGGLSYPQMCNLPIQGICADALMRAIILVNDRLEEAGIGGGLVAAVHDELLIEVPEGDAERARDILERSMVDAFVDTFPGALTNGLAVAKIGRTWADVK